MDGRRLSEEEADVVCDVLSRCLDADDLASFRRAAGGDGFVDLTFAAFRPSYKTRVHLDADLQLSVVSGLPHRGEQGLLRVAQDALDQLAGRAGGIEADDGFDPPVRERLSVLGE